MFGIFTANLFLVDFSYTAIFLHPIDKKISQNTTKTTLPFS